MRKKKLDEVVEVMTKKRKTQQMNLSVFIFPLFTSIILLIFIHFETDRLYGKRYQLRVGIDSSFNIIFLYSLDTPASSPTSWIFISHLQPPGRLSLIESMSFAFLKCSNASLISRVLASSSPLGIFLSGHIPLSYIKSSLFSLRLFYILRSLPMKPIFPFITSTLNWPLLGFYRKIISINVSIIVISASLYSRPPSHLDLT